MATDASSLRPWGETRVVGQALPRVDAYERVTGSAIYAIDVSFPDMLHAAVLRCPHGNARVKRVDTSKAEKMPGVRAVMSAASPGVKIPWYFGRNGPTSFLFDEHCRYAGEEVAVVAADTPHEAADALRAIAVEYEPLPFVVDFEDAMKSGAPQVQEGGNVVTSPRAWERGDVSRGFAEADIVLEETYRTSCQLHACAEVHGSVARWEGDRLTVWATTQGVFDEQRALAGVLGIPQNKVRVISHYMGGGFGSKLELGKHTVIAALLARSTGRPVRLFLNREDDFVAVGNRPADLITLKAGVKKDGTLTALHVVNKGIVGAYPGGADIGYQVMDLYQCPNAKAEESIVYVNAGKECAMRAPGFPQCSWALEQMMDALAEKIGMDPVEFRLKNVAAASQARGKAYTSTGLKQCLTQGAAAFDWRSSREKPRGDGAIRRGVGMAAAMWGYEGQPVAAIVVRLFADGSANLNMGAADIGTGAKTIMAMTLAEELGVPLDRIEIEDADTGTTQYAPPSGGSQTVLVSAPAMRLAAADVRRQVLEIAAEELKTPANELAIRDGKVFPANQPEKAVALSDLKGLNQRRVILAVGNRGPHPPDKVALPFIAQFAEVEVNTRTGEVKVLRFVAAHDSGRVMNRLTYENQVFGGITMGIGFGMKEQRRLDGQTGRMLNANLHDYKVPTIQESPAEMTCLPVDPHDTDCNNVGAKGLGEPATIPTAAAIANAVYNATGVRVTHAPITPMQMLKLLAAQRGRRA